MARGGKREGAGRKRSEPTKRLSVPLSLVKEVEAMIKEQKELLLTVRSDNFYKLLEVMPEMQKDVTSLVHVALLFESWEDLKNISRKQKQMIIKHLK